MRDRGSASTTFRGAGLSNEIAARSIVEKQSPRWSIDWRFEVPLKRCVDRIPIDATSIAMPSDRFTFDESSFRLVIADRIRDPTLRHGPCIPHYGSRIPDPGPRIRIPHADVVHTELTSSSASIFENAISQNVCIMFA